MKPIDLQLGHDVIVKGCLYPTKDPVYLREDLLEIDLPSGLTIDVGWYPENDPKGAYRMVLFRGYWENQVIEPITTPDIDEAVRVIGALCSTYAAPRVLPLSTSNAVHYGWTYRGPQFSIIPIGTVSDCGQSDVPSGLCHTEVTSCSTSSQMRAREYALS